MDIEDILFLMEGLDWQHYAACRGSDLFFVPDESTSETDDEKNRRERKAKATCFDCSVRVECLEYSLETMQKHGIWGGLNEKQRRQVIKQRRGLRTT